MISWVFLGFFDLASMITKLFLQISFSLALLLLCASTAFACSCPDVKYRKEFAKATAIFIGEALEYRDNPNVKQDGLLIVKFKVEKSWKGAKQSEIVIPTRYTFPYICGWYVEPGKRYLVYTYGKEMIMPTGCSASSPMNSGYVDDQIKQLNSSWFRFFSRIFPF